MCVSLQKELQAKFLQVSSIRTCKFRDLTVDTKYPIIRAERAMTHLGHTVMLTLLDGPNNVLKLFLTKRYARVISDIDIGHINMNLEFQSLIFKGFDPLSRYMLNIVN